MAMLRMKGGTGRDDLRSDCHAVLRVFLKGVSAPVVFDPILGGQDKLTTFDVTRDLNTVSSPMDIDSFQIEHVSVEHFLETRDNWDMTFVDFSLEVGRVPIPVAHHGPFRFTGDSAVLDIPRGAGV